MPNQTKNLNADAPGVSASTPNTRKRVSSPCVPSTPKLLYEVTINMMEYCTSALNVERRRRLTHVGIYVALSPYEAIGLAVKTVLETFQEELDGIDITSIRAKRRCDLKQI